MHQLRGRVGRSDHRAYCYLLVSGRIPPGGRVVVERRADAEHLHFDVCEPPRPERLEASVLQQVPIAG